MIVSDNEVRKRKVLKLSDRYRKIWYGENPEERLGTKNLDEHIRLLKRYAPDFVLDYGISEKEMFIDFKIRPGKQLRHFEFTENLRIKVRNYCIDNLLRTWPYAHRDWTPTNIIIDNDSIHLVDWDNIFLADKEYNLKNMFDRIDEKINQWRE